jgi:hypothetical protein
MNEIYMVHMFMCVIFMLLTVTNCTQKFVAQGISSTIKVILITTKYSHQNVFGHIFLSSHPFLMIQGAKSMGLCVLSLGYSVRDR